jgi:hypothetical protein
MNTNRLIKYLKNDLSELTEIFSELEPGASLSNLEIKMILNRINSVNEEFEMLESELTSESKLTKPIKEQERITKQKPVFQDKADEKMPVPEDNTIDINEADTTPQPIEEKIPEPIEEPETEEYPEEDTVEIPEETEQAPEESKLTQEEPDEAVNEDIPIEEPVEEEIADKKIKNESKPQQTIADKYVGSSNSLNEQIANLIEQKDLASKLQQNPIDDLTKAIKLNDKIWYSNELFDGNLDLYRETIRTINKMEELDEALAFLDSNFHFDQEKKSFKSFIEIIYRRFLK